MSHIDDEDKKDAPIQGALGGTQQMIIINESGLYSLILSSKLPTAKQFKRWVTSEVLPAIRRTGGYGVANDRVLAEITALRAELEATRKTALYAARSVAQPKIKKSRHSEKWRFITDILKKRLRECSSKQDLANAIIVTAIATASSQFLSRKIIKCSFFCFFSFSQGA